MLISRIKLRLYLPEELIVRPGRDWCALYKLREERDEVFR